MPANPQVRAEDIALDEKALEYFREYVERNYQRGVILSDPQWHAPRWFRAALHAHRCAMEAALPAPAVPSATTTKVPLHWKREFPEPWLGGSPFICRAELRLAVDGHGDTEREAIYDRDAKIAAFEPRLRAALSRPTGDTHAKP